MTIPRRLEKSAGTEKVTIVVGPSKVEFRVHKNIICQASEFFAAAFNSNFQEAQDGVIFMPEDDPMVFSKLITWLYCPKFTKGLRTYGQRLLYDIYILADKLCMEELVNRTMDRIRENHKATHETPGAVGRHLKHVKHIFDNTAVNSPLRRFVVPMLAYDIERMRPGLKKGDILLSEEVLKKLWEVSKDHEEFFHEFFALFSAVHPENLPKYDEDLLFESGVCSYHTHASGENCYFEKHQRLRQAIHDFVNFTLPELIRFAFPELMKSTPLELMQSLLPEFLRFTFPELMQATPLELMQSLAPKLMPSKLTELMQSIPPELMQFTPKELIQRFLDDSQLRSRYRTAASAAKFDRG